MRLTRVAALLLAAVLPGPTAAEVPARVVSMNLCTDQMALLIAAPGQLVSVSHVAHDPVSSPLWQAARAIPANRASAEQVYLMRPDLVLTGEWDSPATLDMLRRLGLRVERFALETGFADIRANLRRMGDLLGRSERAEALIAAMDAGLAEVTPQGPPPSAILYQSASWTSGAGTLADAILTAAGYDNLSARLGLEGMAPLSLERLVLARPDVLVGGATYAAPALAQEVLRHPAARAVAPGGRLAADDRLWTCGTPLVAEAVRALAEVRPAAVE
jgi:iron complex transport system substrate-binding protein